MRMRSFLIYLIFSFLLFFPFGSSHVLSAPKLSQQNNETLFGQKKKIGKAKKTFQMTNIEF